MAFVTVLWLQGGGLQALISPVDVLTSIGRLTGLVASDLLLVQVLLPARIARTGRTNSPACTGWSGSPASP